MEDQEGFHLGHLFVYCDRSTYVEYYTCICAHTHTHIRRLSNFLGSYALSLPSFSLYPSFPLHLISQLSNSLPVLHLISLSLSPSHPPSLLFFVFFLPETDGLGLHPSHGRLHFLLVCPSTRIFFFYLFYFLFQFCVSIDSRHERTHAYVRRWYVPTRFPR